MRSSPDHQMNLRVINLDQEPHQLVIEGLGVSTKVLDADNREDTEAPANLYLVFCRNFTKR